MNILYIGNKIEAVSAGADMVNLSNQNALEIICANKIKYIPISSKGINGKLSFGITNAILEHVDKELNSGKYNLVFVSQSYFGRINKYIKKRFPNIPIITFCHNIEKHYAEEYYRTKGLKALPFYFLATHWERRTFKYSDYIVVLNDRDNKVLERYYGRTADSIIPSSIQDAFSLDSYVNRKTDIDFLFVGTAFFPNVTGLQWFIDKVLPEVNGNLTIVGRGMSSALFKNLNDRVNVVGFTRDLADYYYRSKMVISPVFSGSGMKTKTLEALMYGKNILGTSEAFEGYKVDSKCMFVCNTAQEFIETINNRIWEVHNEAARSVYLNNYTKDSCAIKYQALFKSIGS